MLHVVVFYVYELTDRMMKTLPSTRTQQTLAIILFLKGSVCSFVFGSSKWHQYKYCRVLSHPKYTSFEHVVPHFIIWYHQTVTKNGRSQVRLLSYQAFQPCTMLSIFAVTFQSMPSKIFWTPLKFQKEMSRGTLVLVDWRGKPATFRSRSIIFN